MNLHRVGVKLFCENGATIDLKDFIPVFHRWIQTDALEGVLIDVADYSHVTHGPGILLVAHEGIYAIDESGGRRGLVYYLRQPTEGGLADTLASVTRALLTACTKLAGEPEFTGKLSFRGDELLVFANDRLEAPNGDSTFAAFRPSVDDLLARLYLGADCQLVREADEKERFSVSVKAAENADPHVLLERMS